MGFRICIAFSLTCLYGVTARGGLRLRESQNGKWPKGPSQQCRDDAGPPWTDDGQKPYYVGFSAKPKLLASGACPKPLQETCKTDGVLSAFHNGPVNCGGRGWFCILTEQKGHRNPEVRAGKFPDSNFAFCGQKDINHDRDGHCHGSDVDDVYGWWVRDHWHRNYAGKLKCCCDWRASAGVGNRCDYRKKVTPDVVDNCRDANEEHEVDWHPSCKGDWRSKAPPADQCWEMEGFGPGAGDPSDDGDQNTGGGDTNTGGDKDGDKEGGIDDKDKDKDGGNDDDGDAKEDDEEDSGSKCNPNTFKGLVCKSGKKSRFGDWGACGRGSKKFTGRLYCPLGWAMCVDGKCHKSTTLCGQAGVKYGIKSCDENGDEGDDDTSDKGDGDKEEGDDDSDKGSDMDDDEEEDDDGSKGGDGNDDNGKGGDEDGDDGDDGDAKEDDEEDSGSFLMIPVIFLHISKKVFEKSMTK